MKNKKNTLPFCIRQKGSMGNCREKIIDVFKKQLENIKGLQPALNAEEGQISIL